MIFVFGHYCHAGVCGIAPHCHRPGDIEEGVFYGAHLLGEWDATHRMMDMKIPIPGYFHLNDITWVDAHNTAILAYHDDNHGLWTVDESDECMIVYELDVGQAQFFGEGSKFSVTGLEMAAAINVDVTADLVRVHQGHSYPYQRHVNNMLPVKVHLVPQTTCDVVFHTAYGEPEEGPIQSVVLLVDCTDDEVADRPLLLEECQTTYGDPAGITCASVECDADGLTQVNFEGAVDGSQQDEIEKLIDDLVEDGYETETHGPYDCKGATCCVGTSRVCHFLGSPGRCACER